MKIKPDCPGYDGASIWLGKQPRFAVPDMERAITQQCRTCNQVFLSWDESNDCVSPNCTLYPYRPGSCRPTVDGVKRAKRKEVTEAQRQASRDNPHKFKPRGERHQ